MLWTSAVLSSRLSSSASDSLRSWCPTGVRGWERDSLATLQRSSRRRVSCSRKAGARE